MSQVDSFHLLQSARAVHDSPGCLDWARLWGNVDQNIDVLVVVLTGATGGGGCFAGCVGCAGGGIVPRISVNWPKN